MSTENMKVLHNRCLSLSLRLVDQVPGAVPHFHPQHFSNTALALTSLHNRLATTEMGPRSLKKGDQKEGLHRFTDLMYILMDRSRPLLPQFEPQALANLMHSVASTGLLRPNEGERDITAFD